jgi:TonB family protein
MIIATCIACGQVSPEMKPVLDNTVMPKHVEPFLRYPGIAHLARIEGVVVVRVYLDAVGKVESARALSGPEILLKESVDNARKWSFEPSTGTTALIVYNFQIGTGLCHDETEWCPSQFSFRKPNFATITAGDPRANID